MKTRLIFSLRALLIVTVLIAVFLACTLSWVTRVREQRDVRRTLQEFGFYLAYEAEYDPESGEMQFYRNEGQASADATSWSDLFDKWPAHVHFSGSFGWPRKSTAPIIPTREVINSLFRKLRGLKGLQFTDLPLDSETIRSLCTNNSLEHLELMGPVSGSDAMQIARCQGLEHLILHKSQLSNDGLAAIASCRNLKRLILDGSLIDDRGARSLGELTRLEVLKLNDCLLTAEGLAWLADLRNLQELSLVGSEVTSLERLSPEILAQLRSIDLYRTPASSDGLFVLQHAVRLETLSLGQTQVDDRLLPTVSQLTELRLLGLAGTRITTDGLKHLHAMPKLEQIWVGKTLSIKAVDVLIQSLPSFQNGGRVSSF